MNLVKQKQLMMNWFLRRSRQKRITILFGILLSVILLGYTLLRSRSMFISISVALLVVSMTFLYISPRRITIPLTLYWRSVLVISLSVLAVFYLLFQNLVTAVNSEVYTASFQWLILLGFCGYLLTIPFSLNESVGSKPKLSKFEVLFAIAIGGIFILLAMQHLGQFITVDEPKWLFQRIPQYIDAFRSLNIEGTYINDKPGVIPVLLSAIPFEVLNLREKLFTANAADLSELLFFVRLPIVVFVAINLIISYFLVRYVLQSRSSSVLFVSLVASTPILIGISQIINPDATVWILGLNTALGFFASMGRERKWVVFLTGILFGLSLLSKFFSQILLFVFLGYLLYLYVNSSLEVFLSSARKTVSIILLGALTYLVLFPSGVIDAHVFFEGTIISDALIGRLSILLVPTLVLWVLDIEVFAGYFRALISNFQLLRLILIATNFALGLTFIVVLLSILGVVYPVNWVDFFLESGRRKDESRVIIYLSSYVIQVFTLSIPIILSLILYFISRVFNLVKSRKHTATEFALTVLFLVYLAGPSLGNYIPVARYEILLYPFSILLSVKFLESIVSNGLRNILSFCFILVNVFAVVSVIPFFYSYENQLAEGNFISDPWGLGAFEAAEKVNTDYPENLNIWVDREGFCEFSNNPCFTKPLNPLCKESDIDLVVLSAFGERVVRDRNYLFSETLQDTWNRYYHEYEPELIIQPANYSAYRYRVLRILSEDKVDVCPIYENVEYDSTLFFDKYDREIFGDYLGLFTNFPQDFYNKIDTYDLTGFEIQKYRSSLGYETAVEDLKNLMRSTNDGWIVIVNLSSQFRRHLEEDLVTKVCLVEEIGELSIFQWKRSGC